MNFDLLKNDPIQWFKTQNIDITYAEHPIWQFWKYEMSLYAATPDVKLKDMAHFLWTCLCGDDHPISKKKSKVSLVHIPVIIAMFSTYLNNPCDEFKTLFIEPWKSHGLEFRISHPRLNELIEKIMALENNAKLKKSFLNSLNPLFTQSELSIYLNKHKHVANLEFLTLLNTPPINKVPDDIGNEHYYNLDIDIEDAQYFHWLKPIRANRYEIPICVAIYNSFENSKYNNIRNKYIPLYLDLLSKDVNDPLAVWSFLFLYDLKDIFSSNDCSIIDNWLSEHPLKNHLKQIAQIGSLTNSKYETAFLYASTQSQTLELISLEM